MELKGATTIPQPLYMEELFGEGLCIGYTLEGRLRNELCPLWGEADGEFKMELVQAEMEEQQWAR